MLRVSLKSLFAHKIRFALTTLAVVVGVAFVVGIFALTDTVRGQFDTLFEEINAGIDLTVRGEEQFEQGAFGGGGAPVPDTLLPEIQAVDGVDAAAGTITGFPALAIDADGEPVRPNGGPPLGVNAIDQDLLTTLTRADGEAPDADDEIAMDIDLAERGSFEVGDQVTLSTPLGPRDYELTGTFTFGEANALAGATLVAFNTPEAQRLFNLEGEFNTIEIALADGADPAAVKGRIADLLPDLTEVVDNSVVVEESQSDVGALVSTFGYVLLAFAGVTVFAAAFLISNTFTIIVGQRVRELALLRAVGASERQIATSVLLEALLIGVVASIIGFGLGVLVASGLNAALASTGFAGGSSKLVLAPRTYLVALGVGVVITVLSAVLPAWKATTVPPVAAMREGFSFRSASLRTRAILGGVVIAVGLGVLAFGLFSDNGSFVLYGGLAVGALLVFLGVAAVSPSFAQPVARGIGAPFAAIWREPGKLARENAARNPRRTSSTAAALMIGLALVTMALIVGNSVKNTFISALSTSVTADWYIDTGSFFPFSPNVAAELEEAPELDAVGASRFGAMQVDDETRQFTAVDYATLEDMYDIDLIDGAVAGDAPGLLIHQDPATDLGLSVGDTVPTTFNQTGATELTVRAIYDNSSLLGNWVIDLDTYDANFTDQLDFRVTANTAEGTSPDEARAAIEEVIEPYPELQALDRDEFRDENEQQLTQLLYIINLFLGMTIVIAFIGIINTLALSVFERTRELGLLRAVGMSNRQVRRMIRLEAVVVAIFGAVLGVAVGLVFGAAVTLALPDDFADSIAVPVGSLVFLVILAAILGVVAAIWPAVRASRLDVLRAIAFE